MCGSSHSTEWRDQSQLSFKKARKNTSQYLKEPIRFFKINYFGEFDPGSGRTLAACLTHASRTELGSTLSSIKSL